MKYGELSLGQVEAVVNKLGGMDGVQRLLSGKTAVRVIEPPEFKVWKTIKLGDARDTAKGFRCAYRSPDDVRTAKFEAFSESALLKTEVEREVDLVVVSVAELGFEKGATTRDIYRRAQELGLSLCPLGVGPHLRLQYRDQPTGEWLLIGIEPTEDALGNTCVFVVSHPPTERSDDLLFFDFPGRPDYFWKSFHRWVFLRERW